MFSRNSEKQKKAFFTRKNALLLFLYLIIIYSINITQQPELLHDGCKKQESNP